MTLILSGILNCDTMKKARTWLAAEGIAHSFHDYKRSGVDEAALRRWVGEHGWERVLNRSGTTFRKLPAEQTADLDADRAVALMLANPSAIRRPVLDLGDRSLVGFDADRWRGALAGRAG